MPSMSEVIREAIKLIVEIEGGKERFLGRAGKPKRGRYTGAFKRVEGKGALKGYLSRDVVNFLIKKYAKGPGLKWAYVDLDAYAPTPGYYSDTYGAYDYSRKELLVNRRLTVNQFPQQVDTIIHEIQHFNQHMNWGKGMDARVKYTKGKPLPSGVDDEWGLVDLKLHKLHAFWEEHYGYEQAPQEREARAFAKNHLDAALDDIVRQELGIPDDPDLHAEVEASRGRFATLMNIPPRELDAMKRKAAGDFIDDLEKRGNLEPDELEDLRKNIDHVMTTDTFRYFFKRWMDDRVYKTRLLP